MPLAERIQDDKGNTTRFLVVQKGELADHVMGNRAIVQVSGNAKALSGVIGVMRAAGFGLVEALSTPTGQLDHQTVTLFFQGDNAESARMLKSLLASRGEGITLLGLYREALKVK